MERISRRKVLRSTAASAAALSGLTAAGELKAQFSWMKKPAPQAPMGVRCLPYENDNPAILYHPMNCERCADCVAVCEGVQTVFGFPGKVNVGRHTCIYCGQCTAVCWNNAVTERFHLQEIFNEITSNKKNGGKKKFVALVAPSTRVTLGEMFKMERGANVEKQMVTALRQIGFDYVFDVTFGADLTVLEETAELEERLKKQAEGAEKKPLFTSCCPSWVRFAQIFFPEVVPEISSCKSPIMMQSAVIKTWFAKEKGLNPEDIVVAAMTPCTAKKYERTLGKTNDLDYALTTRELGWWLLDLGVNLPNLEAGTFDSLLGNGSGAGVIFGNTGGVTEAVMRQLYFNRLGKEAPKDFLLFSPVRGLDGVRKAEVTIGDLKLRVGIVHGTSAARNLLEAAKKTGLDFDFVEVMACRGGCIGGGGLPKVEIPISDALRTQRMSGLYSTDKAREIRLSGANPEVKKLYESFLKETGNPLLHTAHEG